MEEKNENADFNSEMEDYLKKKSSPKDREDYLQSEDSEEANDFDDDDIKKDIESTPDIKTVEKNTKNADKLVHEIEEFDETDDDEDKKDDEDLTCDDKEEDDHPKKKGIFSKFFDLFKGDDDEEEEEETEEQPEEEKIEEDESALPEDVIKILKIQNHWLNRLTNRQMQEFKESDDFQEYKKVLQKYKLIK
jgi:hypothetical protein